MDHTEFSIIGGRTIGDKAEMLRDHLSVIEEVGLQIPHTTVIASEAVDAISSEIGQLPNNQTQIALNNVSKNFGSFPVLAVRSSAEGDASGNGVYETRFSTNSIDLLLREAGVVVNSFQSESATDFRRQAELGEAFALMIQPAVGQDLGSTEYWEHFGPYLSGFGYSSSSSHPNGYLNVVAGIGGGVSRTGGQVVTPENLEDIVDKTITFRHRKEAGLEESFSFYTLLEAINEAISCGHMDDIRNDFRSGDGIAPYMLTGGDFALAQYLIREAGTLEYRYNPDGLLSSGVDKYTGENDKDGYPKYEKMDSDFVGITKRFMPDKLLAAMQQIEQAAGYPVYIEWALGAIDGEVKPMIVQIAPAEQTERAKLEAEIEGKTIAEARYILGSGVRSAKKIVTVGSFIGIEHLREFNSDLHNEGYILVVSSALSSTMSTLQLGYHDCSKAGVIIEIEAEDTMRRHHTGDIEKHLFGASRQTDKFIGEMTRHGGGTDAIWQRIFEQGASWKAPDSEVSEWSKNGSIHVLDGDFNIYADAIVGKITIAQAN